MYAHILMLRPNRALENSPALIVCSFREGDVVRSWQAGAPTGETSRDRYDVHDHLPGGGHRVGHALRDDRLAIFNNLKAFIASLPVVRIGCVGEVLAPELRHGRPGLWFCQLGYVPAASERLHQ